MPAPARIEAEVFGPPDGPANLRGAGWIILSCLAATAMSVAVRLLSGDMSVIQMVFLRSALGLWVIAPFLVNRAAGGQAAGPRFSRPGLHLIRGVLFTCALYCGFYALSALPLATATTLFFLAPVFATAGAAVFTGERVGPRRWAAVIAAFLGALVILRPGFTEVSPAMLAAVGSAGFFATTLLISRPLAAADGPTSILLSSSVIAALAMAIPATVHWAPMSAAAWGLTIVLVAASSARMYADIRAYSLSEAGYLAPFAFLRLLFIAAAGWLFFREGLDGPTLAGATIIIGATVFIAWREAKLRRQDRR